ncbi:MAG TPA: PQQ-dependent sugar dehydrogenase, partial [Rhizomicrobium sp.]|nr:PQQ-dependent sugar dehydrogenase [Rhizomicrobium sp.]
MKRIWLAAAAISGLALSGAVLAQPGVQQTNPQLVPNPDLRMPARKQQAPVPALLQTRANEIFITACSGCHGATAQPGPSAKSLLSNDFLNSRTDAQIVQALAEGLPNTPNHKFTTLLFPDEMAQMPAYLRIRGGIVNRARGGAVPDISGKDFTTQKASFKVETLVRGLNQPWGLAFLPDGRAIFTERSGELRFMDKSGAISAPVKGTPAVFERQDGGMLDVQLHPDYAKNGWIYLSYTTVPAGYQVQPDELKAPNMSAPTMTYIIRGK